MKTTDFIKESIGEDADNMHRDHEVQMARSDCYHAAKYAIELHKMLQGVSEEKGMDGWVSEKITLANDYLRTVWEYLSHEQQADDQPEPGLQMFTFENAEQQYNEKLNEMTAGGTGAGSMGVVVGKLGEKAKSTGKPKKVGNILRRVNPQIGKGIY